MFTIKNCRTTSNVRLYEIQKVNNYARKILRLQTYFFVKIYERKLCRYLNFGRPKPHIFIRHNYCKIIFNNVFRSLLVVA